MSEERRRQVIERIRHERISAIIRTNQARLAADAMRAAVEGGFRMVEFTLTTPEALALITEFSANEALLVGAGTVLTERQAEEAVAAGARFLVSPITDPAVITAAHRLGAPCIPGAFTPTEMETAHRAGADFVKVFPEPYGGVDFIRAIRGPLPHLRLFPTAGVTPDNVTDFLEAGCAGCGFVRSLFTLDDLERRDWESIRGRASRIVQSVTAWKSRHVAT